MGPPRDEPGSPEGTLGFVHEGTGEERRISLHSNRSREREDGLRFTSGTDLPLVCRHPSRQTTNEASSTGRSEELEYAIRPASRKSTGTSARSISTPDTKDWTPSGSTSTHQTVGNAAPGTGATGASSTTLRGVSEDLQTQEGEGDLSPMPRSVEVKSSGSIGTGPQIREARSSLFEEIIKNTLDDAEDSDDDELYGDAPAWDSVASEASRSGVHDRWSLVSDARRASLDFNAPESFDCRSFQSQRVFCARVFEHRAFSSFFMLLTLYALFSPDLDQLFGTKQSKFALSIVTTVVFFLYAVELFMQTVWRQGYICRAYFWLDLVALVSLLPDTWLIQSLLINANGNGAFAAGRSTKLARIIRLASRSTKATRLNRLVRIVRVASLLPRIASVFGKQVSEDEASKVLDRRLFRVFAMLDEDMDGLISAEAVATCKAKFRADTIRKSGSREDGFRRGYTGADSFSVQSSPTSTTRASAESQRSMEVTHSGSVHVDEMAMMRNDPTAEPFDFEAFKKSVLGDELLRIRLTRACKHQVARSNNMQKIANKHSEDVGVKVALGVLALLLVLGLVEPAVQDNGPILGIQYLDYQVGWQLTHGNNWSGGVFPSDVRAHIAVWADKVLDGATPKEKEVLYMDLQHQVFCNQLVDDVGRRCDVDQDVPVAAIPRRRLQDIDDAISASNYRPQDLQTFKVYSTEEYQQNPDKVPDDALEAAVTSTAVLYIREQQEADAKISLYTTVIVIVIILVGIVLLTRDLSDLSLSLLKPLKVLAEDMQSIVHLQLAALNEHPAGSDKSCAEIRMIQAIFDNMKKAINSWGKYVPWPVVQTLLKQGVDAKPEVREKEVSIFFSDIASFTSIVEHLAPDQSLLLLSKYFNEMSRVIDAHQGIVIEFIGDAILAIYGAPLKNPDHPTACVKAALRMLSALDKINAWALTKELPQFSIRCGIHTGRVLVGNMGYHSRIKYGVVGEHAIVPERLEELNKTYNTKLLISAATCARLASDMFVTRPVDYVHLSHGAGSRTDLIHQVLARDTPGATEKHKLRPAASLYRRALRKYRERQFQQAMQYFAEVNAMITAEVGVEDGPSMVMIKRCEAYRANPPPPNWDGVWSER